VAVDGYAWLHRGVHACAAELGRGAASDKHVEFCMGRVALLLHYKVKPLLVFDGGDLPAKAAQEAERRARRAAARAAAWQCDRENDAERARKHWAKCVDVTPAMAAALVDACRARWGARVDFLVAPYEADARDKNDTEVGVVLRYLPRPVSSEARSVRLARLSASKISRRLYTDLLFSDSFPLWTMV
jgi:exonuclease-1